MPKKKVAATKPEVEEEEETVEDDESEEEEPVAKKEGKKYKGLRVGDPLELRPKELPLVIKPEKGDAWANEAQAEFARTLNAYAYRNPEKWENKKDVLLEQLIELAKKPQLLSKFKGTQGDQGKISYKDERFQTSEDKK